MHAKWTPEQVRGDRFYNVTPFVIPLPLSSFRYPLRHSGLEWESIFAHYLKVKMTAAISKPITMTQTAVFGVNFKSRLFK
jgi:hypothetical protein